ncbi:MAG: chemotaxis protein CheW [Pirellulaceae bacterium]
MEFADPEIMQEFVVESTEHLADIESQLLTIEAAGAEIDVDLINTVFRAVHSIKGAAGFLGLTTTNELAHSLENVLNLMRERELTPNSAIVDVMLRAADQLRHLIENISEANDVDVSDLVTALDAIAVSGSANGTNVKSGDSDPSEEMSVEESLAAAEALIAQMEREASASAPAKASPKSKTKRTPSKTKGTPTVRKTSAKKVSTKASTKASTKPSTKATQASDSESPKSRSAAPKPAVSEASNSDSPKPASDNRSPSAETSGGFDDGSIVSAQSAESTASSAASSAGAIAKNNADSNIRVSVESLDHLMNLAGELVLGRNQLLQSISSDDRSVLEAVAAKINQVTCDLQDAIMQTRMQPIGNVFNRFNRVVRDLSAKLNKRCQLVIEGKEVEVDKTIIEAIADPLTHLVRNAVDHGMELPGDREAKGKPAEGKLLLRAFHQSGKVCIEIKDDGAGINVAVVKRKAVEKGLITADHAAEMHDSEAYRLIFMPGFSTADTISDVSGRGVGMDVVRTNIERLGGAVEIDSQFGVGTTIHVTLPLTLAIIPSLIVHCSGDRFAIPQVNIVELVRVRSSEVKTRIGKVKDAEVLRLRGSLLPLVRLSAALGLPNNDQSQVDKRAMNIIVVETGQQRYGLIVDGLFDSEEIVVKPLGHHLKECKCLSGATILGDGRVALILDTAGISQHVQLGNSSELTGRSDLVTEASNASHDTQSLLLFNNHAKEQFAIPMGVVSRIERVAADQIHELGGQRILQYRESSLPLMRLEDHCSALPAENHERLFVVVVEAYGKEVGLLAPILHDVRNVTAFIDDTALREPGIIGSLVIDEVTTRMVDIHEMVAIAHPEWTKAAKPVSESSESEAARILLAEDSKFFRKQVKKHLEANGYEITECEDGQEAWELLLARPSDFGVVVTDIQMPRMNGFQLCENIRREPTTSHLPVVALTSLAGDDDIRHGEQCGVDDYQVKMDREKLLNAVARLLKSGRTRS